MSRRPILWFVTFDGASARLFEVSRTPLRLEEVEAISGPKRPEFSDRPQRVHQSVGERRSGVEPRSDPEHDLEDAFAGRLADMLEAYAARGRFDRVIIAGAPRALGCFRRHVSEAVRQRITHELDRDFTTVPRDQIVRSLADVF